MFDTIMAKTRWVAVWFTVETGNRCENDFHGRTSIKQSINQL